MAWLVTAAVGAGTGVAVARGVPPPPPPQPTRAKGAERGNQTEFENVHHENGCKPKITISIIRQARAFVTVNTFGIAIVSSKPFVDEGLAWGLKVRGKFNSPPAELPAYRFNASTRANIARKPTLRARLLSSTNVFRELDSFQGRPSR
jgi:hypothetical protein